MELQAKTRILAGFAFAELEAYKTSERLGYWQKDRNVAEVIALVHRDAARALEAITVGDGPSPKLEDTTRAEEHLADVIIRILDISQGMNLHVSVAVIRKLEYNEQLSKALHKDF